MKTRYSHNYYPPAPQVTIALVNTKRQLTFAPQSALIDTGADATLVPLSYLLSIQAPATDTMNLRSHWGESREVEIYLVDIQIGDILLDGMEVVGDDRSDEIILGCDVLNQLRLVLDGPRETLELTV